MYLGNQIFKPGVTIKRFPALQRRLGVNDYPYTRIITQQDLSGFGQNMLKGNKI